MAARDVEPAPAPSLGVVVPTLDEERLLPRLLARLRAGPAEDRADRVVVADGGSSDRTRELALEAGAEVVAAPRGRGSQLAAGARRLDCELLLFLHADCVPLAGSLAALRRAFARGDLAVAAMVQRIEAPGLFYRAVERAADARVRLLGMVYGDSGLALRRELYLRAGGFAELPLFEDVELSRRLRRLARPRLVPGAVLAISARRWREEGPLRTTLRNWMLTALFAAGADPARLERLYGPPGRAGAGRKVQP